MDRHLERVLFSATDVEDSSCPLTTEPAFLTGLTNEVASFFLLNAVSPAYDSSEENISNDFKKDFSLLRKYSLFFLSLCL